MRDTILLAVFIVLLKNYWEDIEGKQLSLPLNLD